MHFIFPHLIVVVVVIVVVIVVVVVCVTEMIDKVVERHKKISH